MRKHRRRQGQPKGGEWLPSIGDLVGLRRNGVRERTGVVEAVMPDHTGFWLAADGPDTRKYIPMDKVNLEEWGFVDFSPVTRDAQLFLPDRNLL